MKVLVTGATGGMGSSIINSLLAKNIEVIASSRDPEKIRDQDFFAKVTYMAYDLSERSGQDLFSYFGRPDKVIHLAWDKLKEHRSELHMTTILEDHKAFLSNLIHHGLSDLTCVGTCYEYGLKEGELKETDPASPVVPYAIGKNLLREFIENLRLKKAFSFKWLRVFNVFSPGKSGGNLYSHLMSAIESGQKFFNMSGGEQVRDYLTADEVSDIIVKAALQTSVEGIVNCCSGRPIKLKDMITSFLELHHFNIKLNLGFYPYLPYEPMSHWGSTDKLNRVLRTDRSE